MYAGSRAWGGGDGYTGTGHGMGGGKFTSVEIIESEFPCPVSYTHLTLPTILLV